MIGKQERMTTTKNAIFIGFILALSACSGTGQNLKEPQQWQRANASEAVYQQGPKVSQMLKRDIGRCVVQLQEMKDLGLVKNAIQTDSTGRVLGPDELRKLDDWKTPSDHRKLVPDSATFTDFNGCMESKGWERVFAPGTSSVTTHGYQPIPE